MKNILLFSLLFSLVLFSSCESGSIELEGDRNIGVVPVISDVNPALFVDGSLESSTVKFVVSDETKAAFDKAYIVMSMNGENQRLKIKDIADFPETVTISAVEVATVFNKKIDEISTKDYFSLEIITEVDGRATRSNAALTVRVVCPYDPELAIGIFTVVSSGWEGGDITIEADDEDPYKVYVHGLAELEGADEVGSLEMTIDPLSFVVRAGKNKIADTFYGYDDLSLEGNGFFDSCNGVYTLSLEPTVAQGSFGLTSFTFTKK